MNEELIERLRMTEQMLNAAHFTEAESLVRETRDAIEELQSAQPERKKGKWIITDTDNGRIWHCNCSECGEDPQHFISGTEDWWINKLPNFCPNCGAEMEKNDA